MIKTNNKMNDDYTRIVDAVNSSYLPNGELDMNVYRYKYWTVDQPFNFMEFDYKKLSDILNNDCEEIETKRDYGNWYSIFKYKDAYFEFYEKKNRIIFIYSNNLDELYEMDDISFDDDDEEDNDE
jgi:hypothetical protein